MFSFFENLLKPFPPELPSRPPATLFQFCWHYTRGVWPWIFITSFLVTVLAIFEVMLFGFLGSIIDWLTTADKEQFLEQEGDTLILIAGVVLIVLPLLSVLLSLITHQTVMGNYPMRIRWLAHRYLLRQSFGFYQDEFAGRVATKVMQTALGVRGGEMDVIETDLWSPTRMVIIEFPDMQSARSFVDSEEYAPVKPIRRNNARCTLTILDGV